MHRCQHQFSVLEKLRSFRGRCWSLKITCFLLSSVLVFRSSFL